jgi:hypothetical protein
MPSEGKNPKKHWFFPEETMVLGVFLLQSAWQAIKLK